MDINTSLAGITDSAGKLEDADGWTVVVTPTMDTEEFGEQYDQLMASLKSGDATSLSTGANALVNAEIDLVPVTEAIDSFKTASSGHYTEMQNLVNELQNDVVNLTNAINQIKLVIYPDVLAGELTPKINQRLGAIASY